jgi:sec-independent protein translocase protein TatC
MAQADKPTIETAYPISQHLGELRKRTMYVGGFWLVMFIFCYWQYQSIYAFIIAPLEKVLGESADAHLTMLTLTEAFMTVLKISMLAAIFLSMPFILYQGWRFVAPGLYKNERRYLVGFVISATVLFFAGVAFAYYIVFPLGFRFLISFGGELDMVATLSIAWYLNLVMKLLLAFGIVFELPVVIFFLAKIGLVNAEMLKKYRKFAIVGIFTLAAILTPPDVISQIAMAIPLLFLYELSIWITKVFGPKPDNNAEAEDATVDIYK